jgi:hypothetical protein
MKYLKKILLLWVIFALLDPDPDSEYGSGCGSGSTDPIESGSNWDPQTVVTAPQDWLEQGRPGNAEEAAGGGGVERGPALVVPPVDVSAVLHQELHHLQVVVDASLEGRKDRMVWYPNIEE